MEIRVNITRTNLFIAIFSMFLLASAMFVFANWDTTKTMWHSGNDVKVTIGTQEYSLNEALNNNSIVGGVGSLVNGSGIVLTQVNGKTMVNGTVVKESTQTPIYKCPYYVMSGQYYFTSLCIGQLSATKTCCSFSKYDNGQCSLNGYLDCPFIGYLVQ